MKETLKVVKQLLEARGQGGTAEQYAKKIADEVGKKIGADVFKSSEADRRFGDNGEAETRKQLEKAPIVAWSVEGSYSPQRLGDSDVLIDVMSKDEDDVKKADRLVADAADLTVRDVTGENMNFEPMGFWRRVMIQWRD